MAYVYLLLECHAHEGSGIHGAFASERDAKAAFLEMAEAEEAVYLDAGLDNSHPMTLDWDDPDNGKSYGWAIRELALGEAYDQDVGACPP